jgi:hypothetical protein
VIFDTVDEGLENGAVSPNTGVYLFPTQTCHLQRYLINIVLQMFKVDLIHEIKCSNKKPSIASLLDTNDDLQMYDMYDKIQLLFDQLLIIDKHPSLIVDHFIPKKLILLETNARLLTLSGKFQLLNRMVDQLIQHVKSPQGFHVLIVAQSVRELELIEGLNIGKCLYYTNLSNSKLYDDPTVPTSFANLVCLYLITSSQLYNNYVPTCHTESSKFDLIISFDTHLDVTNPSIQMLRLDSNIPILVPLPLYSIEHIILQNPQTQSSGFTSKDESDPNHKWRLQIIQNVIMNESNQAEHDDDFFINNYGPNMKNFIDWIFNNGPFPININDFNSKLVQRFTDEELISKIEKSYNEDYAQLHKFDYESYKANLAEILNYKLVQLQNFISDKTEHEIPLLRNDESVRQVGFDEAEDRVAARFRQLKQLNEDATTNERKLGRTENYLKKYQTINQELQQKHQYLEQVEKSRQFNFDEQDEKLKTLQEELDILTKEYEKLNDEYDETRVKYQTTSGEAVQLSNKLQKLKRQNTHITAQLTGPGLESLPQLIRTETNGTYTQGLKRLKRENHYMETFFSDKLDKLTIERQQIIEVTGTGSSSRPSNRISRASTPF